MAESGLRRDEPRQLRFEVAGDVGVGALVDGHAGRGVRDEHVAQAVSDTCAFHDLGNALGDVDQLRAPRGVHLERRPAHYRNNIEWPRPKSPAARTGFSFRRTFPSRLPKAAPRTSPRSASPTCTPRPSFKPQPEAPTAMTSWIQRASTRSLAASPGFAGWWPPSANATSTC